MLFPLEGNFLTVDYGYGVRFDSKHQLAVLGIERHRRIEVIRRHRNLHGVYYCVIGGKLVLFAVALDDLSVEGMMFRSFIIHILPLYFSRYMVFYHIATIFTILKYHFLGYFRF